jgi:hypothetical protein
MGEVEYWYNDDSFIHAETVLRRAIGQYARRSRWMYIGLTQQRPEDRFAQHQRKWQEGHQWDRMIVIYHARTFTLMQTVEDRLIRYAETQIDGGKYDTVLENDKNSQTPLTAGDPNGYWVYVLVQA